ncbi:MAG TPA: DUF1800 domain-containing protein [Candidatus Tumulicola sp.]
MKRRLDVSAIRLGRACRMLYYAQMAIAQTAVDVGGMNRPQGRLDATTALWPYEGSLNERSAAHLLRRAGFGGTPDEISRYASMNVNSAVEQLVRYPQNDARPPTDLYSAASTLSQYGPRGLRQLGNMQRRNLNKDIVSNERGSLLSLQVWWLNRMLSSPAPLQEKMALYFHGHFTTAAVRKNVSPSMAYNQNELYRQYALGNLRELTRNVAKDPAMLRYLDNDRNSVGEPNENFARELMELFTLGVDHYSEDDVRNSARAWTGWHFDRFTEQGTYEPSLHDNGSKTFLGQTGNFTGDDIVNIIFSQPQCAKFFATSLLNQFVYNDPEPELVDGLANVIRKNDYNLAPVMSTLLRSRVFYSDRAYRALVKSPVEFVVGVYKTLGVPQLDGTTLPVLRQSGQVLFDPPNVAGWPGGENWINSDTMIARQNFLKRIANSQTLEASSWLKSIPMHPTTVAQTLSSGILQGDVAPASMHQINTYLAGAGTSELATLTIENYDERVSGAAYLAMATPAYQLN